MTLWTHVVTVVVSNTTSTAAAATVAAAKCYARQAFVCWSAAWQPTAGNGKRKSPGKYFLGNCWIFNEPMAVESEPSGWTGWRVYTANTAKRNGKQRVQEVTLFWMVFSFISVLHFHSHFIDMMVFHFPLYPFRLGIRWQNGNCNNNNRMKGRTKRGGEKRRKKKQFKN